MLSVVRGVRPAGLPRPLGGREGACGGEWVEEQLANGAGALHRYTKRQCLVAGEVVVADFGPSAKLSDILANDRTLWASVWEKFKDSAGAPWRTNFNPAAPWVATLPRLGAEGLKQAAKKFKKRTGISLGWVVCLWDF